MAGLRKPILNALFEEAARVSGWDARILPPADAVPARYRVTQGPQAFTARLWTWTVTPGGNNRPPDEYRIQFTFARNRRVEQLDGEPGGKTLLIGWWPVARVFAAWDFNAHNGPLGSSPSCQVKEGTLRRAAEDGMAFAHRDDPGEYVVAFRPEMMGVYLDQMEAMHRTGAAGRGVALLERAAADPDGVTDEEIEAEPNPERKRVMVTVRRAVRSYRFSARVLEAYQHRCAFCGVQLRLLDAAHILPVAHPGSTDDTSNGVALCPLHHRAYDNALITFDHEHRIHVSDEGIQELEGAGMAEGLDEFRRALREEILLPAAAGDRPAAANVDQGNIYRGWRLRAPPRPRRRRAPP